jgi:hypothetical protein
MEDCRLTLETPKWIIPGRTTCSMDAPFSMDEKQEKPKGRETPTGLILLRSGLAWKGIVSASSRRLAMVGASGIEPMTSTVSN